MSKFIRNVSVFLASLPLLLPRAHATASSSDQSVETNEPDAVPLRPLNLDVDNQFASHSSHSSHASHSSHYSGSGGGGYVAPSPYPAYVPPAPAPEPAPAPAPYTPYTPPGAAAAPLPRTYGSPSPASPATPSSHAASSATNGAAQGLAPMPPLSQAQKLKLQLMRVQIRLSGLGLYKGRIDGVRNPETVDAVKRFQSVKGLPEDGMMTTPTLNALGVPAS